MEKIRRKRITAIINLLEAEDVFHVVEAGGLVAGPDGGTEGAVGESVSTRGLVGEFESLAVPCVDHGVIADNIAALPEEIAAMIWKYVEEHREATAATLIQKVWRGYNLFVK